MRLREESEQAMSEVTPIFPRVDQFMTAEDLTAAADRIKAGVDWSKLPKLAAMFEHRPSVNRYWHELVALTLLSLERNGEVMAQRHDAASHPSAEPSDGKRAGDAVLAAVSGSSVPGHVWVIFNKYDAPVGVSLKSPTLVADFAVWAERFVPASSVRTEQGGAWVACSERMPEEGALCVILGEHWSGHGCPPELVTRIGSAATGHWERCDVDELDDESPPLAIEYNVTHWMPLPSPPATNGGGT